MAGASALSAPQPAASARLAVALLLLCAIALPWVLDAFGMGYYLSLASRVLVYAIAASSLNLVLGYGGMVSFGHAAFVGLGAYVTGIMISEGTPDASGKVITWSGTMSDPMTGKTSKSRMITTVVDDNHHTFEMYNVPPGAKKEMNTMTIDYVRKM